MLWLLLVVLQVAPLSCNNVTIYVSPTAPGGSPQSIIQLCPLTSPTIASIIVNYYNGLVDINLRSYNASLGVAPANFTLYLVNTTSWVVAPLGTYSVSNGSMWVRGVSVSGYDAVAYQATVLTPMGIIYVPAPNTLYIVRFTRPMFVPPSNGVMWTLVPAALTLGVLLRRNIRDFIAAAVTIPIIIQILDTAGFLGTVPLANKIILQAFVPSVLIIAAIVLARRNY